MTMMWPRPRRTMDCATRREMRKAASTLVWNIASQSSSVISRNGAYFRIPALLTKRSASRAADASSCAKALSFKSPTSVRAPVCFFKLCNSAARRPVAITCAPARVNAMALARPMPALAPVTNAVLLVNSIDRLYPLALPFQHPVSQDVAADLSGAGQRQLTEVLQMLGQLVVRHLPSQELHDFGELQRGAFLRHHAQAVALAEARIGQADHRGMEDLRMRIENLLHLAREEFLAAAVDDLLAPPGDLHVA